MVQARGLKKSFQRTAGGCLVDDSRFTGNLAVARLAFDGTNQLDCRDPR